MSVDLAVEKLMSLPADQRELILTAYEDKHKKEHYALYWSSDNEDREEFRRFHDNIEDSFSKLDKNTKLLGFLGGNRSGKTERGAFLAVAWLLGKKAFEGYPAWRYVKDLPIPEHGCNIWAVGLDFSVIRDTLWMEKLRKGHRNPGLLPPSSHKWIKRISDSEFQVTVDVEGRVSTLTAKSAEAGAEKFQSASVDLVWLDEEVDESVYLECWQRTADVGGKIVLTLTPLNDIGSGVKKPWVHKLYTDSLKGDSDSVFVKINTLENPHISEEDRERLKKQWAGHPEEGSRLYGDFIRRGGLVFENFDPHVHVIKPFRIEKEWKRIVSIDPAATGTTAVVWTAISPRNDVYIYREYYVKNKTVSDHAKDILLQNAGDQIDLFLLDPYWGIARNNETHKTGQALYRENGIPCRLAPRAEDYGVALMREYISASSEPTSRQPKLFVFNTCRNWIEEIQGYTWATFGKGELKGMSKDKPAKGRDHLMNATQYLLSTRPRGRKGSAGVSTEHNPNASYT